MKTMAMKITEENHPIAVATLPPDFSRIKKKLVIGSYLVINDVSPAGVPNGPQDEDFDGDVPIHRRYNRLMRRPTTLELSNFWTPKKSFKKNFKAVGDVADKTNFFEITRR